MNIDRHRYDDPLLPSGARKHLDWRFKKNSGDVIANRANLRKFIIRVFVSVAALLVGLLLGLSLSGCTYVTVLYEGPVVLSVTDGSIGTSRPTENADGSIGTSRPTENADGSIGTSRPTNEEGR